MEYKIIIPNSIWSNKNVEQRMRFKCANGQDVYECIVLNKDINCTFIFKAIKTGMDDLYVIYRTHSRLYGRSRPYQVYVTTDQKDAFNKWNHYKDKRTEEQMLQAIEESKEQYYKSLDYKNTRWANANNNL